MNNLLKIKMPFSAFLICVILLLNSCGSGQAEGSIWSTVQSVGHSIGNAFSHSYTGIGRIIGLTKPHKESKPALCRLSKPRTMIVFMPISSTTQPPSIFSYFSSTVVSRSTYKEQQQRYLFTEEPIERATKQDLTKYPEIQLGKDQVTKDPRYAEPGRTVLENALPRWYNTPVHKKIEKTNSNPMDKLNLIQNELENDTQNIEADVIHRNLVKPVEANPRSRSYENGKEILMDPPNYITARANIEIKSTTNSEANIQVEISTSDHEYKSRINPDNKNADKNPNVHINETNPNPNQKLIHQKDDLQNKKIKTVPNNELAETQHFKLRFNPEIKKANKTEKKILLNKTYPNLVFQNDEMQNKLIKALISNNEVNITKFELNDEQKNNEINMKIKNITNLEVNDKKEHKTTTIGMEPGYFKLRSVSERVNIKKVDRKPKSVAFLADFDQNDRILSEPEDSTVKSEQETTELPSIKSDVIQGSILGVILFILYTTAIYHLVKNYLGIRKWRTFQMQSQPVFYKKRSLTSLEIRSKY